MKQTLLLAGVLLVMGFCAQAQFTRYFIQFSDKKTTTASFSNPSTYLSQRAIERRTRQQIAIDSTDLPVPASYLDSLRAIPNVVILNVSKWLNQVCIQTADASAIDKINSFPFVKKTAGIAPRAAVVPKEEGAIVSLSGARIQGVNDLSYGSMYNQIHMHDGDYLHSQGFTGRGVVIAILDAGFNNYTNNPVFDSVRLQGRVLGTWDFVTGNASVAEDNAHGAYCFSIMASNRPGLLVGSAPHASYWLFRTENTSGEHPIEEQNWAVAAEFADSAGVDLISSSLGYDKFDNDAFTHRYAQRDGKTALITLAAGLAVKKGILVVNSAGNNGTSTTDYKYVSCPADGDSVFTVGAIAADSSIAALSSWGPNGAGLLKPNAVSVGAGTVLASVSGTPSSGSGTSYACPNLAGLIACLWQAYPEFGNMDIFQAVQQSAHKYSSPDNRYGYGIPNFRKAYEQLRVLREVRAKDSLLKDNFLRAYPVPLTGGSLRLLLKAPATGKAFVRLVNVLGQVINSRELNVVEGQTYYIDYPTAASLQRGVYYIQYRDGTHKQTLPVIR